MCDDKQTIETWNLLKITKIYRGLLKFMANIAVLLKKSLSSVIILLSLGCIDGKSRFVPYLKSR